MACVLDQWPNVPGCAMPKDASPATEVAWRLAALEQNPGHALAYAELARFGRMPDLELGRPAAPLVSAAIRMTPNNETVMLLQAASSVEAALWPEAVERLVQLVIRFGNPDALQTLAKMMGASATQPPLLEALETAHRAEPGWLDRAIREMPRTETPMVTAMTFLGRVTSDRPLPASTGQFVIGQLKAEGQLREAHAMWLRMWKKQLGFVFNDGFESPLIAKGFDWELPNTNVRSRSGVVGETVHRGAGGQAMRLAFTGRPLALPALQQDLRLPPGKYGFAADFDATHFRSEHGMTWVLTCTDDGTELMRSPAMKRRDKGWHTVRMDIEVPERCDWSVRLALIPHADLETKTGLEGELLVDNVVISRQDVSR